MSLSVLLSLFLFFIIRSLIVIVIVIVVKVIVVIDSVTITNHINDENTHSKMCLHCPPIHLAKHQHKDPGKEQKHLVKDSCATEEALAAGTKVEKSSTTTTTINNQQQQQQQQQQQLRYTKSRKQPHPQTKTQSPESQRHHPICFAC